MPKSTAYIKFVFCRLEGLYFWTMNFLKNKYKALIIGFIVTILLFVILESIGFLLINPTAILENIFIVSFWWLLFSFIVYRFQRLKNKKTTSLKIGGVALSFFGILLFDHKMDMVDNPMTISLVVVFCICVIYLLAPGFFKRHQLIIIGGFAICLSYFIYVRLFANPADHHIESAVVTLFFVPLFTLILLWFYDQWKWFQTLKSEKTKAELALLKTQINPHFFFNTLNNLYGLTVEQSKDAPQVVLKLSEMMRYTIYEGKKEVVNLSQEIAYLNNYIELQKIRFHKNVVIEFNHKTDDNYEISPLLFIVFLENAFKHGVDSLRENAFIKMDLIAENDEIYFSIENNFDPKEVSAEKGIGLENLERRLALSYPEKHDFSTVIEDGIYKSSLKINLK